MREMNQIPERWYSTKEMCAYDTAVCREGVKKRHSQHECEGCVF